MTVYALKNKILRKTKINLLHFTWSGLSPGGTHVYSSSAHPLSSSLCECLWWCCIRASCSAKPAGAACTGLLNGSWWGAPPAPLGNAMAIAIGGPGPRPSPEGPPVSVEVRWCSSRGHLQLLHTFLKEKKNHILKKNALSDYFILNIIDRNQYLNLLYYIALFYLLKNYKISKHLHKMFFEYLKELQILHDY